MAKLLPDFTQDIHALERFSKIRLVVMDLDGTLINVGRSDVCKNISTFRRELSHPRYRVRITIATGRTLRGASVLLDKLSFPQSVPVILYNGSLVIHPYRSKPIIHKLISADSLFEVLQVAYFYNATALVYVFEHTLFGELQAHEYVLGLSRTPLPEYDFNGMSIRWYKCIPGMPAVTPTAILINMNCGQNSQPLMRDMSKIPGICYTKSGSTYVEIRPAQSNKAVALEYVANFLGISRYEVLALGDNDNDAEMLSWSGIGVAVSNASQSAKENSDFICRQFDDIAGGAIEVLRIVKRARYYFYSARKHSREDDV